MSDPHFSSLKQFAKSVVYPAAGVVAVMRTLYDHRRGKRISKGAWNALLRAHCQTNGKFTEWLSLVVKRIEPPREARAVKGLLGSFSSADIDAICRQITRDGIYIFENKMPVEICDKIERFARSMPAKMYNETGLFGEPTVYEASAPRAQIYKFSEQAAVENPAVQSVMADEALAHIAERYLQTSAAIGGVDTWWSTAYGNGPSSEAAQLFHFDFDAPPRWLKLFIYVNDVTEKNGPHVFVKGSHKAGLKPAASIFKRGYVRISDDEIDSTFGKSASTKICGMRGTVFFADTRGFHKGNHPISGDRLLCQLIYCSPIFDDHSPPPPPPKELSPGLREAMAANPRLYARYRQR